MPSTHYIVLNDTKLYNLTPTVILQPHSSLCFVNSVFRLFLKYNLKLPPIVNRLIDAALRNFFHISFSFLEPGIMVPKNWSKLQKKHSQNYKKHSQKIAMKLGQCCYDNMFFAVNLYLLFAR